MVAVATETDGPTGGERLVGRALEAVRRLRRHPLLRKIVEAEPELLLPYLLGPLGETQREAVGFMVGEIVEGQRDGTVRRGNPDVLARELLLVAQPFVFGRPLGTDVSEPAADAELERLLRAIAAP